MSFLALDIGNTRLKWALYADSARPGEAPQQQGAIFLENIDYSFTIIRFKLGN